LVFFHGSESALGAQFHGASPNTQLVVAHGGLAMPALDTLVYASEDGDLAVTLALPAAPSSRAAASEVASEHYVVGPGELVGLGARDAVDQKRSRADNDLTIAQRLEASSLSAR
jgi:hypothetical protein